MSHLNRYIWYVYTLTFFGIDPAINEDLAVLTIPRRCLSIKNDQSMGKRGVDVILKYGHCIYHVYLSVFR